MNSRAKGRAGENQAERFLQGKGFTLVARNWFGRSGEIDIIAERGGRVHFVEVKAWRSADISFLEQSVGPRKLARIRRTAAEYLGDNPNFSNSPVQFDLVFIDKSNGRLEFIEDLI